VPDRCRTCGYTETPWYKRVIQEVGDVVLGRRYWRNYAQKLETEYWQIETHKRVVEEREILRQQLKFAQQQIAERDAELKNLRIWKI